MMKLSSSDLICHKIILHQEVKESKYFKNPLIMSLFHMNSCSKDDDESGQWSG